MRLYQNKSNYRSTRGVERNRGGNLGYQYPIAPLLSGFANASYEHSKYSTQTRKDDTYTAIVGISYSLAKNVQIGADTGYEKRHSTNDIDKYDEFRVSMSISYQPSM